MSNVMYRIHGVKARKDDTSYTYVCVYIYMYVYVHDCYFANVFEIVLQPKGGQKLG